MMDEANIEKIGDGVTLNWLHDKKMMIFTVSDSHRATVDLFIDKYIALLRIWPPEQPFLIGLATLHDDASVTPYIRERTQAVIDVAKERDITGRFALVLKRNFFLRLVRVFMQMNRQQGGPLETCIFFTQPEAVAWLEKAL